LPTEGETYGLSSGETCVLPGLNAERYPAKGWQEKGVPIKKLALPHRKSYYKFTTCLHLTASFLGQIQLEMG